MWFFLVGRRKSDNFHFRSCSFWYFCHLFNVMYWSVTLPTDHWGVVNATKQVVWETKCSKVCQAGVRIFSCVFYARYIFCSGKETGDIFFAILRESPSLYRLSPRVWKEAEWEGRRRSCFGLRSRGSVDWLGSDNWIFCRHTSSGPLQLNGSRH